MHETPTQFRTGSGERWLESRCNPLGSGEHARAGAGAPRFLCGSKPPQTGMRAVALELEESCSPRPRHDRDSAERGEGVRSTAHMPVRADSARFFARPAAAFSLFSSLVARCCAVSTTGVGA